MKNYEHKLILPSNSAIMQDEEMRYLEGGKTISYNFAYTTTWGALGKAISYKNQQGWKKISAYDLAAEIWFHAYAYYSAAPMQALCSMLGFKGIGNTKLWKSLKNGIDVVNGLDTVKECGVPRYQIFRATYAFAQANPGMI